MTITLYGTYDNRTGCAGDVWNIVKTPDCPISFVFDLPDGSTIPQYGVFPGRYGESPDRPVVYFRRGSTSSDYSNPELGFYGYLKTVAGASTFVIPHYNLPHYHVPLRPLSIDGMTDFYWKADYPGANHGEWNDKHEAIAYDRYANPHNLGVYSTMEEAFSAIDAYRNESH